MKSITLTVPWSHPQTDEDYMVEVRYIPGCAAVLAPNDKAHPGEPPEIEVLGLTDGPYITEELCIRAQEDGKLFAAVEAIVNCEPDEPERD